MRISLTFIVLALAAPAAAQTISPVDVAVADQFTKALVAGDDDKLTLLLSDKATVSVSQQIGPNGPNRQMPEGNGKAAVLAQYHAVVAAVGMPNDAKCEQPDRVSYYCQFTFGQPGRGMQSMIMFDGKKIGALMIKYGGAALQ